MHAYSPAHVRRLQTPVSVLPPGHGFPPLAGGGAEHVRVRDHVPLSHDVLHTLHGDQAAHWPSTTTIFKSSFKRCVHEIHDNGIAYFSCNHSEKMKTY